jgi:hypothetical protein
LDAVMRASRKMIVPRPSDTELSRVYKELMRVTVYPRRCWSRRSMFTPYLYHPGIFSGWAIGTHVRYNWLGSNVNYTPITRIEVKSVFPARGRREAWTPEFTVLIVFERNNCVLYFFLLDEPAVIKNCRYRFVYGTQ